MRSQRNFEVRCWPEFYFAGSLAVAHLFVQRTAFWFLALQNKWWFIATSIIVHFLNQTHLYQVAHWTVCTNWHHNLVFWCQIISTPGATSTHSVIFGCSLARSVSLVSTHWAIAQIAFLWTKIILPVLSLLWNSTYWHIVSNQFLNKYKGCWQIYDWQWYSRGKNL